MSWLNHLFLVYILFYFPWPYLCNIFLIIWNDIIMCPLPHLRVGGSLESTDCLSFVDSHFRRPWDFAILENGYLCVTLFCFTQSLLLELKPTTASEGGLLWFMWNLWRQAIVSGTFSTLPRGDVDMRAETSGGWTVSASLGKPVFIFQALTMDFSLIAFSPELTLHLPAGMYSRVLDTGGALLTL